MIIVSRVKQALSAFVKVLVYGKSDVRTAKQYLPFGIDSKPVKDMLAAYISTSNRSDQGILGYQIQSESTNEGELMLYSTDSEGNREFEMYFKNDGTLEIGGDSDNLIRYTPLNSAMSQLASDINTELGKIAAGITTAGGAYTPAAINIDISGSKIDDIKVKE